MSSPCAWSSVRSLHLGLPFLLLALPSAPFPLPQLPEVCGKLAQLLQRECGLTDEFTLSTGYEPKAHDLYETSVEPYVQLLDSPPLFFNKVSSADPTTMTLHSKTCSIKYIERKLITLYEKTCLSVCRRRQCPTEQGDLLEIDRGHPVSTETQKHRSVLCSTIKKSKFLQNAKQELVNTNFKQLEPKKSNDFFKDTCCSKI